MDGVAQVSAGGRHTMAIKKDGSLWAWGWNYYGQLGDGTKTEKTTPVKIMDGVTQVSAGDSHTMAIKKDGSLWAWGYNSSGQLGDGTTKEKATPVKVMDGVTQVAGDLHTMAIKNDGSLWAWGNNWNGVLGDGTASTITHRTTPVKIMDGTSAPQVSLTLTGTETIKCNEMTYYEQPASMAVKVSNDSAEAAKNVNVKIDLPDDVYWKMATTEKGLSGVKTWTNSKDEKTPITVILTLEPNTTKNYYFAFKLGSKTQTTKFEFTATVKASNIEKSVVKKHTLERISTDAGGKVTLTHEDNKENKTGNYVYKDSYFSGSALKLNTDLMKLSLGVARSAYSSAAALAHWSEDGDFGREKNIAGAFKLLGFTWEDQYINYDVSLNDNSSKVAFALGRKVIAGVDKPYTLVACIVRGGAYGAEWGDNFRISDNSKYHYGFNSAATKVQASLYDYLADLKEKGDIVGDIKLWITGYSRGAAVANLLAAKIDDSPALNIKKENVFAYTFATPQGVLASAVDKTKKL
jgi:hypothetical protein